MIRLNQIERAADLRNLLPTGASQFGFDGITDEAHEDAIAEFQRDLDEAGNLWSDLDPVQKLELLRSMEHHFTTLAGFGLIVAAGSEPLRLRSEHIEKPFTMDVLHVVIAKASGAEAVRDARPDRAGPIPITAVNGATAGWPGRM